MNDEEELFSEGYRFCDSILFALMIGGPALVYFFVIKEGKELDFIHYILLGYAGIAGLGLKRIRPAFALIALPFFAWAAYSFFRAFITPNDWVDIVNPVYTGKWGISIVIEYSIGAYFWERLEPLEQNET